VTPQLRGAPIFARLRYPPGLMWLHYSSSVDVRQPIRTFVAAGISQFSCTRPGQYGLPVLGFAAPILDVRVWRLEVNRPVSSAGPC